jgi:hypothetical protein
MTERRRVPGGLSRKIEEGYTLNVHLKNRAIQGLLQKARYSFSRKIWKRLDLSDTLKKRKIVRQNAGNRRFAEGREFVLHSRGFSRHTRGRAPGKRTS